MTINFLKMHGLGNDFVVIDARQENLRLDPETIRQMGNRKRGVGFDQLIVLESANDAQAAAFMRIYNPDGSESGACGNATRCIGAELMRRADVKEIALQTVAGVLKVWQPGEEDLYTVDMGPAKLGWQDIPLAREMDTLELPLEGKPCAVSMGNPHAVFFMDDVEAVDLAAWAPKIENDPLFPERANVHAVKVLDRTHMRLHTWERGTGITEACGSGACAVLVAAVRRSLTERKADIELDGGTLTIEWREDDGHVLMTGPVATVFEGTLR